jgi:hypothetical protein
MEAIAPPVRLRIRNALGWPLLALVVLLVGAELATGISARVPWSEAAQALWYVGWGLWIARLARRQGGGLRLYLRRPRERRAWAHVAMALPLFVLSVGLIWLQLVAVSWALPGQLAGWLADDPAQSAAVPLAGVLGVLTAVALAPVVEELAFRGVLLRDWSRRWGRTAAVLATAALFAVLHPGDLLGSFAFGVVLATIRFRTGTLIVPVACHALYNALGTLLSAGDSDAGPVDASAFSLTELRGMWWVGALAVAAALPVVIVFLRRGSRGSR